MKYKSVKSLLLDGIQIIASMRILNVKMVIINIKLSKANKTLSTILNCFRCKTWLRHEVSVCH